MGREASGGGGGGGGSGIKSQPWSKHLPMLILVDVYLYRKLSNNHVRHQAQTEQLLIR